ncbi:MAG: exodeoxyribonuclease VII large subunit, partial [Clostridia bacterium]|nr:exodeoxyribonuclease VII large subunit [Clostridia bacterium]
LLIGVSVYGEITNLKPSARAIYFDIKDTECALPCVCFDQYLMKDFKFGDRVTIVGKLNYYAKTGKLSFIVSKIEKFGVGDLYKQYIELKAKLEKEGVFDERYKKDLPKFPKRVGVVTSETGAVIRDIVRVARKKNRTTEIVLFPVKVQGIGADSEIIKGVKFLDSYNVDLIIVARGGGSFEDYQPFNTEQVVRTIFECNKPVISAIGHENDWSLIDFVADVRASTPSVASEIAFFDEKAYMQSLYEILKHPVLRLEESYKNKKLYFDNIANRMSEQCKRLIQKGKQDLGEISSKVVHSIDKVIDGYSNVLDKLSIRLSGANPIEIMKRGFSQIKDGNGNVVKSITSLNVGDDIEMRLMDGRVYSLVTKIEESGK